EDVAKRFEAYGFETEHIDGHDPEQVRAALDRAVARRGRPSLILARTIIGIGAPTKAGTSKCHGAPLGKDEIARAKTAVNWPSDQTFVVPDEARQPFAARAEENRKVYAAWKRKVAELAPEQRDALEALFERRAPSDLYQTLLAAVDGKADATRSLAAKIEQKVAALVPALVGGAADLAESTKTTIVGALDVK